jgi:hypothetical protein
MMKTKYPIFILIAAAVIFSGCKKSLPYNDVIYFTGTETTPETKFTLDEPASIGISVTSSAKMDKDVAVSIKLDPQLVESYNNLTGKSYEFLPAGSYELSANSLVIENGSYVSESAMFSITSLDQFQEGSIYCVPITITGSDDDIDILEASRTKYLIINKTIITRAVDLNNSTYFAVDFESDPSLSYVPALTFECRIFMNGFQTSNPYISTVMGIEESFLLRFGDVSVANNQLQLAGGLISGKKYPVTSKTYFSTGRWYHIAAVYNGSTIALYVDGVLDAYTDAQAGGADLTYNFNGNFYLGYSAGGRRLRGYISEARVWTRALSAAELQSNLCYVNPEANGLLAYWRFDNVDTSGNLPDLTGNGFDAVPNNEITWVDGVRCPK